MLVEAVCLLGEIFIGLSIQQKASSMFCVLVLSSSRFVRLSLSACLSEGPALPMRTSAGRLGWFPNLCKTCVHICHKEFEVIEGWEDVSGDCKSSSGTEALPVAQECQELNTNHFGPGPAGTGHGKNSTHQQRKK